MFTPKDIRNILSYLQSINSNIKIDASEFNNNLKKHSDYPTLLSITDVVSSYGFKSSGYKLDRKGFESLPSHFLAQIKNDEYGINELILAEKSENFILFDNKQLNLEEFLQLSTGAFILVENTNTTMNKYFILCTALLLLGIFSFLYNSSLFSYFILLLLSTIGLYLSVYFFESLFNIKITFLNKICHKSEISDCKTISSSKKWKIFNYINFSDLGLVFFSTQIICFISLSLNVSLASVVEIYLLNGVVVIPTIILSIFYQLFIEKKWCRVCLLIALNLIFQLAFAFYLYTLFGYPDFKYHSLITFGVMFIGGFIIWTVILKQVLYKNKELTETNENLNSIVNDYNTFKAVLLSKQKKEKAIYNNKYLFSFGSEDVLNITIITDPFCKYCKSTNRMMKSILDNYTQDVNINFLFNVDLKDKDINFYRLITDSYLKNNRETFFDFICNENNTNTIYDNTNFSNLAKIDEYLANQNKLCNQNEIAFFPTILINGYEYPLKYDVRMLDNFINQLIADKNRF